MQQFRHGPKLFLQNCETVSPLLRNNFVVFAKSITDSVILIDA